MCCSFLDESPRWLVSQGGEEEAIKILNKIAKINKVSDGLPPGAHFKEEQAKREAQGPKHRGNFTDLVRTPNMRKTNVIVILEWSVSYNCLNFRFPSFIHH